MCVCVCVCVCVCLSVCTHLFFCILFFSFFPSYCQLPVCPGSHYGMEKTTERVSNQYYWMGIISGVRNTIHTCLNCSSRSKTLNRGLSFSGGTSVVSASPITTSGSTDGITITGGLEGVKALDEGAGDEDEDGGGVCGMNEGEEGLGDVCHGIPTVVKQEAVEKQAADFFFVAKDVCSHFWQKVGMLLSKA